MIKGEVEIALGVYTQAYESVRHAQKMRTEYFNIYIVILGASIAALMSLSGSPTAFLRIEGYAGVGILVWLTGILTLARIERLTGLVTHDLHTVRQVRAIFRQEFPDLAPALPRARASIKGLEFDRPVWSRDRTIEPIACMLAACTGIGITLLAVPLGGWLKTLLFALGSLFVLWCWAGEVGYQHEKHAKCCHEPRELECPGCHALTKHELEPAGGWRRFLLGRTVAWTCSACGQAQPG